MSSVPTTLAAAELDAHGVATYRFYTEATSAPALRPAALPAATETLFAGGLGLVLEPMADTVVGVVERVGDDVMVMVDLNCRPAVIDDRDRYLGRVDAVLARADVVKVSDDDLAYLSPGEPPIDAARRLLARGPGAVLLTAGGSHVTVLTADDERLAVPVEPVDGGRHDRRRRRLRRRVHVVVGGVRPAAGRSRRHRRPRRRGGGRQPGRRHRVHAPRRRSAVAPRAPPRLGRLTCDA